MCSDSSSRSCADIGTPQIISPSSAAKCKAWAALAGLRSRRRRARTGSAERKIRVLAQYGFSDMRSSQDVRTMLEFAKTEADRQAMTMLFARDQTVGRIPAAGRADRAGGGAPTRVRRHHDRPGLHRRRNRLQFDVDPLTGEQVQALVAQLPMTAPASSVAAMTPTLPCGRSLAVRGANGIFMVVSTVVAGQHAPSAH